MTVTEQTQDRYCVKYDQSPHWHIPLDFPYHLGRTHCGLSAKSGEAFSYIYRTPTCEDCIAALKPKPVEKKLGKREARRIALSIAADLIRSEIGNETYDNELERLGYDEKYTYLVTEAIEELAKELKRRAGDD